MTKITTAKMDPPDINTDAQSSLDAMLSALGGSANQAWNRNLVAQVFATVQRTGTHPEVDDRRRSGALFGVLGVKPTDEVEAMIAAQLVATHNATMDAFGRAAAAGQYPELSRECINQATRLSRSFAALLEALSRYRGKGQQTVRVEHVQVYAGGQAIVGSVETAGGGVRSISEE